MEPIRYLERFSKAHPELAARFDQGEILNYRAVYNAIQHEMWLKRQAAHTFDELRAKWYEQGVLRVARYPKKWKTPEDWVAHKTAAWRKKNIAMEERRVE